VHGVFKLMCDKIQSVLKNVMTARQFVYR